MNMTQPNQIKLLKNALRADIKNKLKQLTTKEQEIQSNSVVDKLLKSPEYQNSFNVSIYLSSDNEINTTRIVQNVFESGKKCFIPRYNGDNMEMVILHSLQDFKTLPVTKWNIKQPSITESRTNCFDCGGLDLIIVPGVAFTKGGDRLGHGKGYYDRFLHECYGFQATKRPKTIALAFKEQIVEDVPVEESDVKIDLVLTAD
ncbi:5-formyltetrahydrofolate cyclo-ligase [Chrysoperla carnea]|uniref:5-formyltetrahydrofolate cyclo-ligase n=1 Tax=Chrysoperla carnea TaxID=189513 RepID=UPI001D0824C6|nr:5-formyltetrahydrofolate cyclo-ligase [Chrysoperla carnea]